MGGKFAALAEEQPQGAKFAALGGGEAVESEVETARADELIEIARNGLINAFEGIPDIATMAGSALVATGTKGVLTLAGEGELASEIPFFSVEDLPSHKVKTALNEMGVKTSTPQKGDLVGNIVDIFMATLPFIAGGALTNTIKERVKSFVVAETSATVAGAGARTVAEQSAPDSPGTALAAELVASVATANIAGVVNLTTDVAKDITSAVSKSGVERRAAKKLQLQADDAAVAAEKLDGTRPILDIAPGRQTGDQGLIALSREVELADETTAIARQSQVAEQAKQEITKTLGGGGGGEQKFVNQLQAKATAFEQRMSNRLNQVKADVERVIANIGDRSPQRLAEASKRAKGLIEGAHTKEVNIEKGLWNKVDLKQKVPDVQTLKPLALAVKTIKDKFGHFAEGIPTDQIANIKKLIRGTRKGTIKINDLKQMRTSIGAQISDELGSQTPNRIRLTSLREIDDALLDVMENSGISDELADAIAQSRAKNVLFNKGEVGRIRGFDTTGTAKVRPELTLNQLIKAEEKGIVAVSDLFLAAESPEMREAVGDYMLGLFSTEVSMRGGINPRTAKNFMDKFAPVLDEVPAIKSQIQEAINTGVISKNIIDKGEAALATFSKSGRNGRALRVMLSHEDPVEAMDLILRSQKPNAGLKQLVLAARQDKTGAASNGLKDVVVDSVLRKVVTGDGKPGQVPRKFMGALENSGLYSKEQISRLKKVVIDLEKSIAVSKSDIKTGDPFKSIVGSVLSMMMLKFVTPVVTKGTGGGSIAIAQRMSKLTQFFAEKIGIDAVNKTIKTAILDDPKLLSTLLKKPTSVNEAKEAITVLNSFLLSAPTRAAQEDEK